MNQLSSSKGCQQWAWTQCAHNPTRKIQKDERILCGSNKHRIERLSEVILQFLLWSCYKQTHTNIMFLKVSRYRYYLSYKISSQVSPVKELEIFIIKAKAAMWGLLHELLFVNLYLTFKLLVLATWNKNLRKYRVIYLIT